MRVCCNLKKGGKKAAHVHECDHTCADVEMPDDPLQLFMFAAALCHLSSWHSWLLFFFITAEPADSNLLNTDWLGVFLCAKACVKLRARSIVLPFMMSWSFKPV